MSVSYTLRMPDALKWQLDAKAKELGTSTSNLVCDACWVYLGVHLSNGAAVAQSVERRPEKPKVVGSIPIPATPPT